MKENLNYISYLEPGNIIKPLEQDNTKVVIQLSVLPILLTTGDYKVLPYDTPSNLALISEERLKDRVASDLTGKSKTEIKVILQQIADAGYYDLFLHGLSKNLIIALQEKLKSRGLYQDKIDGIIGKNTINAYRQYNVDGIAGERTKLGYRQLLNPAINYSYGATCTPDKGCAEFVTHSYNKSTDEADKNGVVGNAWRMPMNIVKAGGLEIYNIYSDPRFKKNRTNVLAIRNLHLELLAKNKIDLSSLKPGDIVGMYNPGSPYQETADREGTTFNSHVGLVVGLDADGTPIIEHNMHGNVRRERADRLGKRLISVAVRPNLQGRIPEISWDLQKSDYTVDEKIDNDNLRIYRDSMAGIAPTIAKIFPNVPLDKMLELSLGILGRETNFMNDLESNRSGMAGFKRDAELWVRANIFREGNLSKSSDLTKTKFTSFTPEERQFLGINSPEDLNDPKKAGAAVLYLLSKNYNYMNNYLQTYPELGLTDEDKFNATALSYNQGMGNNSPARSWGFNSDTGVRDDEEIKTLRQHSDVNLTVDSYPATKYAKVDKLLSFTRLKPGRLIYRMFGKDREGYAATALKNIQNYVKRGEHGMTINYIDYLKEGSGIHIKKKNRGKFTRSAKAAGEGVQEHAHKVMNDPNATPLQRKRANFAIQAKKWHSKHENGGILSAAFGDSIVYSTAKAKQRLQNLFKQNNDFDEIKNPVEHQTQENSQNQGTLTWDDLISSFSTQKPESTSTTTSTRSSGSGPRGYRNYNPLNIRISSNPWPGKVSNNTDGAFEQFTDMAHGFRAGIKNMQTWINRGKNTLRDLISTWAPDSDGNNSASYAKHVSDATGIGLDDVIDPNNKDQMTKIAYAMAKVENGIDANMNDVIAGWNLV